MINHSLLQITPAEDSHREFSYQVKKAAMGDYITRKWGWDEEAQRDFHAQDWLNKRPRVILYDNKPIGTIYMVENEDHIEIGQFYIIPEYQNKGIGSHLFKGILDRADRCGLVTKLAYMHINPAASLYRRHGFKTVRSDDTFCFAERQPGGGA
jgi:GNAT superfamily N-acetyltransferase